MDWTIQNLGALGEFVGSIGVIITLVYLAVQIRQNTQSVRVNNRCRNRPQHCTHPIRDRHARSHVHLPQRTRGPRRPHPG
jgi:hypothetical protein